MHDLLRCDMPLPVAPVDPEIVYFRTIDVPTDRLFYEKWVIRKDGCLVKLGYRLESASSKKKLTMSGSQARIYSAALNKVQSRFSGSITFGCGLSDGRSSSYQADFVDGQCTGISCKESGDVTGILEQQT